MTGMPISRYVPENVKAAEKLREESAGAVFLSAPPDRRGNRRVRRDRVEVRRERIDLTLERGERGDRLRVLVVQETRRNHTGSGSRVFEPRLSRDFFGAVGGGGGDVDGDARDSAGGASEGALGRARAEARCESLARLQAPERTAQIKTHVVQNIFPRGEGLLLARASEPRRARREPFGGGLTRVALVARRVRRDPVVFLLPLVRERAAERLRAKGGLRRRHRAHGGDVRVARGEHQDAGPPG
mmetsp:Transcript_5300/g.21414  ORF Transcript_5300/g.21414 Transcript_5300/m.21414 type:complete len:243 (+) Transcript_5300:2320-3048(+)